MDILMVIEDAKAQGLDLKKVGRLLRAQDALREESNRITRTYGGRHLWVKLPDRICRLPHYADQEDLLVFLMVVGDLGKRSDHHEAAITKAPQPRVRLNVALDSMARKLYKSKTGGDLGRALGVLVKQSVVYAAAADSDDSDSEWDD